jgi:hypothetical protein
MKPNPSLGATRSCPHCQTTILQRATVCPACRHILRFDAIKPAANGAKPVAAAPLVPMAEPFRIESTLRQPEDGAGYEYCLIVVVTNDRGEELTRKVISVGSLKPSEARTFTVWVEAYGDGAVKGNGNGRLHDEPAHG